MSILYVHIIRATKRKDAPRFRTLTFWTGCQVDERTCVKMVKMRSDANQTKSAYVNGVAFYFEMYL